MLNNTKKGLILLIVATLFWSGNYICGRYLAPALPPTLLNTVRWAISAIILWGLLRAKHQKLPLFTKWKEFAALGLLGIFVFSTLTYEGLTRISASRAGMISALIPIFILLCTLLVLKDKSNVARLGRISDFDCRRLFVIPRQHIWPGQYVSLGRYHDSSILCSLELLYGAGKEVWSFYRSTHVNRWGCSIWQHL
ncbi:DMT family transporter [Bacillus velezensis]|uniref:DMT family transporter n=1 Tax=Bacillus velezensis TaxID=492670 RepID=UPI0024168830|nr:DMT family transporter [Bacillus velezensis]WFO88523.1 DMT family transporter [Bacillus velezensis]